MSVQGAIDAAAARAVGLSVFGKLAPRLQGRVLEDHRDVTVEQGHRFMGRDQPAPHRTGLVVTGLLRMYVESPDGRQITFRYAGPGYFLGAALTVGGLNVQVAAGVEAVTAARVLYLNQERLRTLAQGEMPVAWALLDQMVIYQRDLIHVLAGTAFGSIRQRVAMHLLTLGTTGPTPPHGELTAPVTQQGLADAVGSTRETVARALGELRDAGLIATQRNVIVLRSPEALASEAHQATGAEPVGAGRQGREVAGN
jgi:CRP/FNR family transcriptional regulator